MAPRTRNPANARARPAAPLPLDVRLMEATAKTVFVLAAAVLVAAWLAWLARSPVFTLRAIQLDGDLQRSHLAALRANALPQMVGNFFSIDLDRGRAAFESVPWVRHAVVRRVWPNQLSVTLEEHRVAALWQSQGERDAGNERLVNVQGEVFEANLGDVEDENLVALAGPDGTSAQMLAMRQRLDAALVPMATRLTLLKLSSRGSWHAELESGAELELGRGSADEVVARTERFVRTVGTASHRFADAEGRGRELLTADLRHPDGYALRLRGVSTAAPAAAKK